MPSPDSNEGLSTHFLRIPLVWHCAHLYFNNVLLLRLLLQIQTKGCLHTFYAYDIVHKTCFHPILYMYGPCAKFWPIQIQETTERRVSHNMDNMIGPEPVDFFFATPAGTNRSSIVDYTVLRKGGPRSEATVADVSVSRQQVELCHNIIYYCSTWALNMWTVDPPEDDRH